MEVEFNYPCECGRHEFDQIEGQVTSMRLKQLKTQDEWPAFGRWLVEDNLVRS